MLGRVEEAEAPDLALLPQRLQLTRLVAAPPLTLEHVAGGADVPVAIAQLRPRHEVQHAQRHLIGHGVQRGIILEPGWYEWPGRVVATRRVDREPGLDPVVADAAGVRGRPDAQRHGGKGGVVGQVRWPAATGEQIRVLRLKELGQLVPADELVGRALVVVLVVLVLQVAEGQGCARGERPAAAPLVPDGVCAHQPLLRPRYQGVRLGEVLIAAAQDQGGVARDVDMLQRRHEQGVGLPTAGSAAVQRLQGVDGEELRLLRVWRVRDVASRCRPWTRSRWVRAALAESRPRA